MVNLKVLGIDLAGNSKNPTGICIFKNNNILLKSVKEDDEIINIANRLKPNIIAIHIIAIFWKYDKIFFFSFIFYKPF